MSICGCIIENLLVRSFESRTINEKNLILQSGKPTPDLNLKSEVKDGNKKYIRTFRYEWYHENSWLCGCQELQKLFCWPCLLFSTDRDNIWTKNGVCDINNFQNLRKRHESSVGHITCMVSCLNVNKNRTDSRLGKAIENDQINQHNESVKQNRYILRCLIDIMCFLAQQDFAFQGQNEKSDSVNYLELLDLLATCDDRLAHHLQKSTAFKGTSKEIQNDLINSIAKMVLNEIKNEISKARFISIMMDETTDISNFSYLATTVRYSNHNEAVERFLGFTDVSDDCTTSHLANHVSDILKTLQGEEKLIAQTYDEATVISGQHCGLQILVKKQYNQAIFVHCYAHQMNLILKQSVNHIQECKIFFETLNGFGTFFSKSSKRTNYFDEIVRKYFPNTDPTTWNHASGLIKMIYEVREDLLQLLYTMMNNPDQWDNETSVCARGYHYTLKQFDFNFLIYVFHSIFPHADALEDTLQNKIFDIHLCSKRVVEFVNLLNDLKSKFDIIWEKVKTFADVDETSERRKRLQMTNIENDEKTSYRRLFFEILDTLSIKMNERFIELENLRFMALLDSQKFQFYKKVFPEDLFKDLIETYQKKFDYLKLKSELIVFYNTSQFLSIDIFEIYKKLFETNLNEILVEVSKLCEMIIAIPVTSTSTERPFSALKRIETYLRNNVQEEHLSKYAILSIEKDVLKKLRKKHDFHNEAINIFIQNTKRCEYIFK